jgi:hypothetical protein
MLSALRREKPQASEVDGCDPAVFAEQCATYLERAIAERKELAATDDTRGVEETTPPAQTAGAVGDSSGTAAGTPEVEGLADFDELMLFEQIGDEPVARAAR